MYFAISFLAALMGVALAGLAAFIPDTGVDGTPGAFLALTGAAAVLIFVGLLSTQRFSRRTRTLLVCVTVLTGALTALAAWFLMQNQILLAFAVSLLALLAGSAVVSRKSSQ